jgi:hypothetical protein
VNEKIQLKRLAKLGINHFESIGDVERMQKDMLRRLQGSSVDPDHYAGLANCRLDYCGRVNCLEVCCFGTCRRRLTAIPAICDLLQKCNPPLYEVRIIRGVWARPYGKLQEASIEAAKQLNRRALDTLHDTRIVAVGTFKVAPTGIVQGWKRWICEIHQIVAGVQQEDFDRIFLTQHDRGELRTKRKQSDIPNMVRVRKITKLGPTISKVLRQDLRGWRYPWQDEISPQRPTKAQRREFYSWLIGLSPDARIIRYGCDQHFHKLEKKSRPIRAKVRKKRPYPHWLEPYMFGTHSRDQMDDERSLQKYAEEGRRNYQEIPQGGRRVTDPEEIRKYIMDEKPGTKPKSKRRRSPYIDL